MIYKKPEKEIILYIKLSVYMSPEESDVIRKNMN